MLVLLSPIWVPLTLLFFLSVAVAMGLFYGSLHILISCLWLARGKDVLFVYPDSPTWRDHMLNELLPALEKRSIVLNWSERRKWTLRYRAVRAFGGRKAFNPAVFFMRPFRRPKVFRFWAGFHEWKMGSHKAVEDLTKEVHQVASQGISGKEK
jgi:hypothetical protein